MTFAHLLSQSKDASNGLFAVAANDDKGDDDTDESAVDDFAGASKKQRPKVHFVLMNCNA